MNSKASHLTRFFSLALGHEGGKAGGEGSLKDSASSGLKGPGMFWWTPSNVGDFRGKQQCEDRVGGVPANPASLRAAGKGIGC